MLKMSYASCPDPSPVILVQFNCSRKSQKNTKNPNFKGSRSFKVIDVNTNKKLVTIACYAKRMSVHICNRFHATQASCSKITTF